MKRGLTNLLSNKLNIGGSYFVNGDGLIIPQGIDGFIRTSPLQPFRNSRTRVATGSGVTKVLDKAKTMKKVKEKQKKDND